MSGPSKNTTTYSASDLQRYLKGEMSSREMHDLEMAALEDPFLADALEGFEKQGTPDQAQTGDQKLSGHLDDQRSHLDDLRARLESRVSTPTRKLFPWLRIAAAAILLIGLGVTAWYGLLNKNKEPDQVSQSKVPATPAPLAMADSTNKVTPAASATLDSTKIASAPVDTPTLTLSDGKNLVAKAEPNRKRVTIPAASEPHFPAGSLARADKETIAPPTKALSTSQQPPRSSAKTSVQSSAPSPADSITFIASNQSNYLKRIKKDTSAYNTEVKIRGYKTRNFSPDLSKSGLAEIHPLVFSGKVLDVHNNPLPGATLFLAGPTGNNPVGTVTDLNGNFSLKVYPKDSVLKVTVGMAGYRQTSLAFNTLNTESSTGNLIHLAEQPNALDEVVVSGYGAKRKETRAMASFAGGEKIDSLWINAKPVMGKQAYLDYLAAGKKNIGADSSIRGAVIISFDVTKKGELTSFKVEQSLTPAHDAGVIHLISEGPPWKKVSKGGSVRTAVRVVF
jgi:hypothetical protein